MELFRSQTRRRSGDPPLSNSVLSPSRPAELFSSLFLRHLLPDRSYLANPICGFDQLLRLPKEYFSYGRVHTGADMRGHRYSLLF